MTGTGKSNGKLPATVITGFLGAGKTSMIRHLLATANGRRLALIINEFGDLGVDAEVLKSCGIAGCAEGDVVELANGCICCTVADDFVPAMEALLARPEPPDHIVIETSGLALPKPLVKAFNWPEIRTRVTVDGVIAVIDGEAVAAGRFASDPAAVEAERRADQALDHDSPLEELFEDQLACADLVVLNKTDLLDERTLARVCAELGGRLRREGTLHGFSNHAMGSRALGLSAVLDLDGDGAEELLLPAAGRRKLRLISFAGGRFRELGTVEHRAAIVTDFQVRDRDGNGRADIAYGLADGTLVELLR